MKSANPVEPSTCAQMRRFNPTSNPIAGRLARAVALLAIAGLFASSFYLTSSATSSNAVSRGLNSITQSEASHHVNESNSVVDLISARPPQWSSILSAPLPQLGAPTVTTYASDCMTPKTVFNVQDADKTVCAKIENASSGWQVIWSNANSIAVQTSFLTSGNQDSSFTLTTSSNLANLGDWRVILFEPFGGSVYTLTPFTVVDAANPIADLLIDKAAVSSEVAAGAQAVFTLQLSNNGPSSAADVQITDTVPADTTFVSFAQLSGPVFTCSSPATGDTGMTNCSIANLDKGETATFLATYLVNTGVPAGTEISNTANVSSGTPDRIVPLVDNNISSAAVRVATAPCVITTSDDIVVDAASGEAGAIVTYDAPTSTGDCGQTPEGASSPISCNPASGSFFALGATSVICTGQTGGTATFQVTVNSPGGGLTISLNGADPLTHECGTSFADPGATAFDGTGQPVEITITGTTIDRDTPTGTYVLTYTATDGTNSVSTTRTVNVVDTTAPAITIEGANPYRIQQGSCLPFVDPGVSANDGCAGSQPVTSSILGPGGLTAVDPNTPGTYTVTYTATDGTHQATATRTVLVGQFSEDEVDQPASSNIPPTLVLNGADQITIECGTGFTDPGATASVCGASVAVTTSGTVDSQAPGIYSITYTATANGFTSEATRIVRVEDTVAPVITLLGDNPMNVGFATTFTDPGATASDGCAGDLTSAITVMGSVDTNIVGPNSLTYTVSDPAGHSDTKVRTVNVLPYNFTGFFSPVVNPPVLNTVNAGRAVPVKFSLGGDQGLNIFAAGSPSTVGLDCGTGVESNVEETLTAGSSSLSYDAASDQYIYVWKTESSWAGTCRQLVVTLKDGTVHVANFKFR